MANLGKFQTQDFNFWTGITTDNHLKAAFHNEPQRLGEFIQTLQSYKYGPTLINYLSKFKKIEFERDDEYIWDLATNTRRNINLVGARTLDGRDVQIGDPNVGVGGEEFELIFDEHWFNDGDVVVGNMNEAYPIRLLGHPRMEGTHAVHRAELMGGVTGGIPAELLQYGQRFSKEYAPVEKELSRGVSDIHFSSTASVRNEFSRIRIRTKVPGNKFNEKIAIGVPGKDRNGNMTTTNYWMHKVDMQLEDEFTDDKNNLLMYARSNRLPNGEYMNIGKSGMVLTMGAGIRELMEQANFEYYNKFSLKLLNDSIFNLIDHLPKNAMPNTITVTTGRRGAVMISEAIANEVSGWQRWDLDAVSLGMVRKTTSELHPNAFAAGGMFTEWHGPMNVKMKVFVDPMRDDPVRNKIPHHLGGLAESYRMEFDLLGNEENNNINLVGLKGEGEIRGYKVGLRNPFDGNKQVDFMATDEDATEVHKMWTGGALVKDPTAHFTLVPSEYAYAG